MKKTVGVALKVLKGNQVAGGVVEGVALLHCGMFGGYPCRYRNKPSKIFQWGGKPRYIHNSWFIGSNQQHIQMFYQQYLDTFYQKFLILITHCITDKALKCTPSSHPCYEICLIFSFFSWWKILLNISCINIQFLSRLLDSFKYNFCGQIRIHVCICRRRQFSLFSVK